MRHLPQSGSACEPQSKFIADYTEVHEFGHGEDLGEEVGDDSENVEEGDQGQQGSEQVQDTPRWHEIKVTKKHYGQYAFVKDKNSTEKRDPVRMNRVD